MGADGRAEVRTDDPAAISAVAGLVASYRPDSRRLRCLIALLTGEPMDLAALVQRAALPRQTVESVLSALGEDLSAAGGRFGIRRSRVPEYRDRFGYDQLQRTEPADPLGARLAGAAAVVQRMAALVAQAPPARTDLDHVPATPETLVRRALWLESSYDLAGAVLLFVGDHDLTSLAVGQISPQAELIVADIDEATLEFIDRQAGNLGIRIRCLAADLRFGLPERATGRADLVFTDPPYTPEGMELFLARGLQGLANRDRGRVVVAYGYSDLHPALGFQGQSAAARLNLAYEAVLPHFNRYAGAQAVGSASDLYVWRPTARTWRTLDRFAADAGHGIYTRGVHAVESQAPRPGELPAAVAAAAGEARFPVALTAGGTARADGDGSRLRLATLLSAGVPASVPTAGRSVLVDLTGDPGSWLLRALLATNASRVVLLVPSNHPDLAGENSQRALTALLRSKYSLRFLRSQPDPKHAIVVADAADPAELGQAGRLAGRILGRAHGKVGNTWREALIEARRESGGEPLSKREARAAAESHARRPELLDTRLIDLPRHQITQVIEDAAASAPAPS